MPTPNIYLSSDAAGAVQVSLPMLLQQDKLGAVAPHQRQTYLHFSYLAGAKMKALSDPGVDPVLLSIVDLMQTWQASTAYAVGDYRKPTAAGHYYQCVSAGTSDASEPTWPTDGGQVADGTVVWQDMGNRQPVTAIKLAATQAGLAAAVAGASLNCGLQLEHGAAYAMPVWVQFDDTLGELGTYPTMALQTNMLQLFAA